MIIYDPKITGSFQVNGSTVTSISEVDTISGSVASLNAATSSYALSSSISGSFTSISQSFASERLKNTTDTLTGDLTVTGTITAQEFHTEFVSASIIYQSGSTQFGDTSDDTHLFQGKVGIGTDTPATRLNLKEANTGTEGFIITNWNNTQTVKLGSDNTTGGGKFSLATNGGATNILLNAYSDSYLTGGNVGIGTTSPEETLDVSGSILINNNEFYKVERTDGANFKIAGLTSGNIIQVGAIDYTSAGTVFAGGDDITFKTAGADGTSRMRIYNTLITIPTITELRGDIAGDKFAIGNMGDGSSQMMVSSRGFLTFNVSNTGAGTDATERARIDVQGNLQLATTALSGSGDPRLTVGSKGNYYDGSGTGLGDFHIGDGNYGLSIGAALGGAGAGDTRIWTTGGTHKLYFGTNGGDKVSINSAGNVGIGTTEGGALLHLRSAAPYIYLDDTSTTGTRTRFQLTVGDVGSTQTGTFSFNNTAGTSLLDVMTINENGNVGVGTTAAATKFHSYTSVAAPAIIAQGDSGNEQIVIKRYSNANEQLIFGFHSSDYGRIQAVEQGVGYRPLALNQDGGSVGIGNYTPVSKLEVRDTLNSTNFTGITVTNTEGAGSNLSRAGIAFKAYDWVQGAIWHGRNMGDGNQGALVLGTNPDTNDLTVGGVVGRMYIINDGNVGIGTASPTKKLDVRTDDGVLIKGASGSVNGKLSFLPASGGRQYDFRNDGSSFVIHDASAGSDRLYFHYNGNIGIAQTSPANDLHIGSNLSGNNYPGLTLQSVTGYLPHIMLARGDGSYSATGNSNWIIANSDNGFEISRGDNLVPSTSARDTDFQINNDGNVGIGTVTPGATLDHRGSYYNGADNNASDTFIASGNYSSGTWYDVTTTSDLGTNGIYILQAYVDDYGAGGGTYFCWYASVPFNWVTTGTNRTTNVNFPTLLGTGHAAGTIPSFRITQELSAAGAKSRIQFNPNNNWSGMDNGSGKSFRVYIKRIAG